MGQELRQAMDQGLQLLAGRTPWRARGAQARRGEKVREDGAKRRERKRERERRCGVAEGAVRKASAMHGQFRGFSESPPDCVDPIPCSCNLDDDGWVAGLSLT